MQINYNFFGEVNWGRQRSKPYQNLNKNKKKQSHLFCPPPFFFCFYLKNVFLVIAPFFDGHISGLMFSLAITLPQDVCYGGLIRTYLIAGVLQVIVLRRVDQNLPHCWCSPGDFTTPGWSNLPYCWWWTPSDCTTAGWSEPTLLLVNSRWLYYSG